MQVHPGAPGTARQGRTRSTIVSTNDGGVATQPRAPGHERPRAASRAARHGRLSAATRAPGADVPPATTAGAPGQHRLSAVPAAPDHDRSDARHQRAPGHGRPLAALSAARHGRPCATPRAPGADVPLATAAGAPGQYRLSAAQRAPDHFRSRPAPKAPGHGRPLAAPSGVAGHDRPRATLMAPGADVPPAITAGAPGQYHLSAVAIATVALPAGLHRPRQEGLPRVPANPRTLNYPPAHRLNHHSRFPPRHSRASGHPRPPVATGGPQRGQPISPASSLRRKPHSADRPAYGRRLAPSPGACSGGGLGRGPQLINQVHPAIQVPPQPRSCSTADTSLSHHHPSRAPPQPPAHRVIAAEAAIHVPLPRGGTIGGPTLLPLSKCWRGGRGVRPATRA